MFAQNVDVRALDRRSEVFGNSRLHDLIWSSELRRRGQITRKIWFGFGVIIVALGASMSLGFAKTNANVALICVADPGVSQMQRDLVCGEFEAFLKASYPTRNFGKPDAASPQIELTVTQSNERSLGLAVTWAAVDGSKTQGTPLRTSFFDRNADAELRRRFFDIFLKQNPLPF